MELTLFLFLVPCFLAGCVAAALIISQKLAEIEERMTEICKRQEINFAYVQSDIREVRKVLENQKAPASSDQR